jgi:hypothetical protein
MVCDVLQEKVQELFGVFRFLKHEGTPDEVLQEHVSTLQFHVVLDGGVIELLPEFDQTAFNQLAGSVCVFHAFYVVGLDFGGLDGGRVTHEDVALSDNAPEVHALLLFDELVEDFLEGLVSCLLDAVSTRKAVQRYFGVHR